MKGGRRTTSTAIGPTTCESREADDLGRASDSVSVVKQALLDLSAKVIKEGRPKVVVKIMYDRGTWEQLWNPHAFVKPKAFKPLDMPMPEEVPGLHLEVIVSSAGGL